MSKGVCQLSVIPLRSEPNSKSELVSQMLFGETYDVLEEAVDWVKIKTDSDNYIAWISQNQFVPWDEKYENIYVLKVFPFAIGTNLLNNETCYFLPGSLLHQHEFNDFHSTFKINHIPYKINYQEKASELSSKFTLLEWANLFKNTPYLWGGRTFLGIDFSGYTQLLFKLIGYQLPRDAYEQAELGELIPLLHESKLGDLAFFANETGKIIHVGLIIGNGDIIHASGTVRVDILDSYGIYNEKEGKHTHKLKCVKRLF
jgi:hypothetical protein